MKQTFKEYFDEAIAMKTDLDKEIHSKSATSPLNDIPLPTQEELESDDYIKGKIVIQGLKINIENPYGSIRSGTNKDGKYWEVELADSYGEIHGYDAADGDFLDLFLRKHLKQSEANSLNVIYVVDQIEPSTHEFDEHKVVFGYSNIDEAKRAYLANYQTGWLGLGAITPLTMPMFKYWIKNEDLTQPLVWSK